jgi:hypothetical protein
MAKFQICFTKILSDPGAENYLFLYTGTGASQGNVVKHNQAVQHIPLY